MSGVQWRRSWFSVALALGGTRAECVSSAAGRGIECGRAGDFGFVVGAHHERRPGLERVFVSRNDLHLMEICSEEVAECGEFRSGTAIHRRQKSLGG